MESNLKEKIQILETALGVKQDMINNLREQIELLASENNSYEKREHSYIAQIEEYEKLNKQGSDDPSMYPLTPTCCMCGNERMDWKPNTKEEQA